MSDFTIHTIETSPEQAKPALQASQKAYGSIPNLHAVMAESPQLLEAYRKVHELFTQTSLNNDELTVVWQTINKFHNCHYCLPAHSAVAQMMGVDAKVNDAVRNDEPLANEKLEVLRSTTLAMVDQRGELTVEQSDKFYKVGYRNEDLLAIILGISHKVMSNFTNHVANTPIDSGFEKFI